MWWLILSYFYDVFKANHYISDHRLSASLHKAQIFFIAKCKFLFNKMMYYYLSLKTSRMKELRLFFHYFCKHRKPALNLKLWISPLCFLAGGLLLYTTGQKVSMTVVKNWLKVVRVKAVIHFSLRQPFANMYIYILQLQKNASWTHSVQIHHTFGKKPIKITKKTSSH